MAEQIKEPEKFEIKQYISNKMVFGTLPLTDELKKKAYKAIMDRFNGVKEEREERFRLYQYWQDLYLAREAGQSKETLSQVMTTYGFNFVEDWVALTMDAMFPVDPPFEIKGLKSEIKTSQTDYITRVLAGNMRKTDYEMEFERIDRQGLILGTLVSKGGWRIDEEPAIRVVEEDKVLKHEVDGESIETVVEGEEGEPVKERRVEEFIEIEDYPGYNFVQLNRLYFRADKLSWVIELINSNWSEIEKLEREKDGTGLYDNVEKAKETSYPGTTETPDYEQKDKDDATVTADIKKVDGDVELMEGHHIPVEIDGKKTALWVDGRKAGEESTPFRPCDVFPGGGVKRNTLAATRDGKRGFKGVIDHVAIYHTVHDDYAALPEPTLDSPERPTESYLAALKKKYGNLKALNAKADALSKELMGPYLAMEKRSKARQQEIMERCPEYVKAVADLAAAEKALEARKRELATAFSNVPENARMGAEAKAAEMKHDALRNKVHTVEREVFGADAELVALTKQRNEVESRLRAIEQGLRKEFDKRPGNAEKRAEVDALRKQVNEKRAEVQRLEKEAFQADAELQELYTKRNGHESDRREREKALRTEFDARADITELVAKADAARKRRHDGKLNREARDQAGKEEDQVRRRLWDLWNIRRSGDERYTRAEHARNELNRPIQEREAVLRSGLRKESELAREYDDLDHKLNGLDRELRTQFDRDRNNYPEYAEAYGTRADLDAAIRARQEALRDELRSSEPIYQEQKRAEQVLWALNRTLRDKREIYVSMGAADLVRKVADAKGAIKDAETLAWEPYAPERWLYSFNQQAFRGYYNTAYPHYFKSYVRDVVGGGEMREDPKFLKALVKVVSGDDDGWRTRVDWDWRMREEMDGSINDMPLMKKWLARVRGPVVKEKPAGVK